MATSSDLAGRVLSIYEGLSERISKLSFAEPVRTVYNPLSYAWPPFEEFHRRYLTSQPRLLFLGMNPGPFGMVQTGIPFGDPVVVREWMGIESEVRQPPESHPKRPIVGLTSERREVSGTRLWGLFRERFGTPQGFFADHYVANYCPLAFLADTGRNVTPDKLPAQKRRELFSLCDAALAQVIEILAPKTLIGIGRFAEERLATAARPERRILRILHPSPASPAANKGWAEAATRTLQEAGVW